MYTLLTKKKSYVYHLCILSILLVYTDGMSDGNNKPFNNL